MLAYYKQEIENIGGESEGKWISALAFVLDEENIKTYQIIEKRIFTSRELSKRKEGWPLSYLAIDPDFNKYVSEITAEERQKAQQNYSYLGKFDGCVIIA